MIDFLSRLFRLQSGEGTKLLQFGLFGFMLQLGMGIGFSAGDAVFLANVGADGLPLVFMLTPVVMLGYTAIYSYLLVKLSIGQSVDVTLAALIAGGALMWALIDSDLPPEWRRMLYLGVKLYLAMWYIALYSLFWNFTDAYFDIQDAKRLFPLFAAFCALGTASGATVVSLFAETVPMQHFFMLWAVVAFLTAPIARLLRRRWKQIAESDGDLAGEGGSAAEKLAAVGRAFGRSRYTVIFTLTLFGTLLMTNLAEYQYATVLQEGRSEAELAALFGTLYAASNAFNLVVCLFVFNRLVTRFGVRNVALIQPITYFAVFGYFFLEGGTGAALAAFFAYHGVLTSIEYNNQNLLFNAVPSAVKRPLRTLVEGIAEPVASMVAGGFLLYTAQSVDMRELSGIGVVVGAALMAIVVLLRNLYPLAMAANMRHGWMNFDDRRLQAREFDTEAKSLLKAAMDSDDVTSRLASRLLVPANNTSGDRQPSREIDELVAIVADASSDEHAMAVAMLSRQATPDDIHIIAPLSHSLPHLDRDERRQLIELLGQIGDGTSVADIIAATSGLAPRECRAVAEMLADIGETAIPQLIRALRDKSLSYRARSIAARALAEVSYAQFASQLHTLVRSELRDTRELLANAKLLERCTNDDPSLALLARAQRERIDSAVDFALELLAIGGLLPNFDLLIVSLHSSNAKVRGNAIEAIESGLEIPLFRMLEPMLHRLDTADPLPAGDIESILDGALVSGMSIEMALAAEALHSRLDRDAFAERVHRAIGPEMPELLRSQLLALSGFDNPATLRPLEILITLAAHPRLGSATLEALLAVTHAAEPGAPAEAEIGGFVRQQPFRVPELKLHAIAGCFPDLALVMLRSQDGRLHAA